MQTHTSSAPQSSRRDAQVIGLVGLAHGTSHFFHLILAPLFFWLKPAFGLSYAELGLLVFAMLLVAAFGATVEANQFDEIRPGFWLPAALIGTLFLGLHMVVRFTAPYADPVLLPAVALINGIGVAFLRRLDTQGVVRPGRSPGGQRRYSRLDIARVQHVTRLADEGMTLAGIRRILLLEAEVADLRNQIAALQAAAT